MAVIQLYAPSGPGRTSSYVRKGLGGHWAVLLKGVNFLRQGGSMSQQRLFVTHPLVALKSVGDSWEGFTEHWRGSAWLWGTLEGLGQPCEAQGLLNPLVTLNSVGKTCRGISEQ